MKRALFALVLVAAPAAAQEMDHSAHQMNHSQHGQTDAAEPAIPAAPAPPPAADNAADRFYPADRMAKARAALLKEGRFTTLAARIDRLEVRSNKGKDGYAWEGEAWYGGDIDRIVIASEGEGSFGEVPEQAELRAVWRHALDPWWNLQMGVRHDVRPDPERSYAVLGVQGLAPYWFEAEGQVFVSNKGDVHLRAAAGYDQRITQRLILEPEFEINAALQDVPELGIGRGIESIELGARLRYEIKREFAPYVGLHWERKLGRTADFARAHGEGTGGMSAVFGLRAWF